jgi:3-oxoacyl-[acyl-carrier protein] reductase
LQNDILAQISNNLNLTIMISFKNKKIIVTGAASGIGKAITLECVKNGAIVFAFDVNKSGLSELQDECDEGKIRTFDVDVSDSKQISQIFETFKKDNVSIDCLVNNAGIYLRKSIFDYSDEEINRVIAVNVKSAVYLSREFAKSKIGNQEYGVIINIASIAGEEGSADAIYGLSKAALIGLTKSNAMNFSPYIRVNAIAPGIVSDTPMGKSIPKERVQAFKKHELIHDPIKAEDVANTALFLLSDAAKHYTGAVFDINNGYYLR